MIITFRNKHHPDVVMFGDIAGVFLKVMGESETPPGILRGADIKAAEEKLKHYLRLIPDPGEEQGGEDRITGAQLPPPVKLQQRALPLLEMLEVAYRKDSDVIWE